MRFFASVCVAIAFAVLVAPAQAQDADLVLWGGPIHTGQGKRTPEAVAVRDGRIVHVGSRARAERLVGPNTDVVDLRGAALFPGFVDAHAHLRGIGQRELTLNLEGTASLAAMVERVAQRVSAAQPGETIWGRGWIETHWPEARFPTHADLDRVAPNNPVLLLRVDGHALIANSAALNAAGVTAQTQAPEGGEILRDSTGAPTGMLIDQAMRLVESIEPRDTPETLERALRTGLDVYRARGWTGMHNMSVSWREVEALERLNAAGALPIRIYNSVEPEAGEHLLRDGPRASADGMLVTRAIKFYMDGALGSRGAALFEPYADAPDTTGLVQLARADVLPIWERALRQGVQIATHAIGDRGNDFVLSWYAEAFARVSPRERRVRDPRWRIEHAQVLRPQDIPRFARSGIIASMQPSHAISDLHFAPARLGETRLNGAYAWRRLVESGAALAGGSDAPVERGDPLIEFYAAVARRDLNGYSGPGWHLEDAVDRETALRMFTYRPAYAAFAENERGVIARGRQADFSVFSVDLMTAPLEEISRGRALLTIVGGRIVFREEAW